MRLSLQSWPRWQTRAHSVQQQSVSVSPHVRHSKMSWLMCSAPVHVKLHVSLQQSTCSGERSAGEPSGNAMDMRVARWVARSSEDSCATRLAASNSASAAG